MAVFVANATLQEALIMALGVEVGVGERRGEGRGRAKEGHKVHEGHARGDQNTIKAWCPGGA